MGERNLPTACDISSACCIGWYTASRQSRFFCRSLLNHGFDSLRLVNPQCHPDDIEARNRRNYWTSIGYVSNVQYL